MGYPLYEIAIFQMYTLIILGICLLFSSGRKISKAVALIGYLFMSMVAFGAYTSQTVEQAGDNTTILYVGCAIAVVLPILLVTNLGRKLSINIVASFLYDVLKFLWIPFSAVLRRIFRRAR